jgi:hypothetical protein
MSTISGNDQPLICGTRAMTTPRNTSPSDCVITPAKMRIQKSDTYSSTARTTAPMLRR